MIPPTATVLLVFGRGVTRSAGGYVLTPGSGARVAAAAGYVTRHRDAFLAAAAEGRPARIVFSGGWAEASEGAAEPPAGSREGDLMLGAALAAGLDRYADLHAETRSRSTLENVVHVAREGLLPDGPEPLGLVSHAWHLPRIRYLTAKVLGRRGADLVDVPASGGDDDRSRHGERLAYLTSRVCLLGVRDPDALLRRERRMVALLRRAERGLRRPAPAVAPVSAELLEQVTSTRSALDGRV
ncbi:ElyC/SanA/YdcF family protein [Actinoplanes sp. NPDC049548]|uniref:YdcF family protein n=1 Tax=Actinoplanes sp. NPDC049548 TaxID=3155152 RepID=UPI0034312E1A